MSSRRTNVANQRVSMHPRTNSSGSTIRCRTIRVKKSRQQPTCWIEAAATADLQDSAAGMNERHRHWRHAFHTPSTCEATPPHSCTNLQLTWAIVALFCSANQRGWNGGQHDVQDQGERTRAYRSSVAPSLSVSICCSEHTNCSEHVATATCANCPSRFLPAASTTNLTQASNSES